MTIDTACSGSLIAVDLACRYLESGDADGAIVAGCNLYMSPEHNMDQHAMTAAASPSGRCWTFDARADGYIKAEAVNCLILKRLDDAVRHKDPIRAIIRGTSTNSDGWTAGIASPSAEAQASAIRGAYERAGIAAFDQTAYLECHGTGTLAGDPIECSAASSVFSASRPRESPLRIGSVKSNIGHSEPAAGISGMLKTILAIERGVIPGNPTFEIPNPKIDFGACKLLALKEATPWPQGMLRRASVNLFGYGGSNAHAIVEHPTVLLPGYEPASVTSHATADGNLFSDESETDVARRLLLFSANDEISLKAQVQQYIRHLSNPAVTVKSADLAYTLAQRRTRHFFRAYAVSEGSLFKESEAVYGKLASSAPRISFVFTGQGAQWPQMGSELMEQFPVARKTIERLDQTLQSMADPPSWTLASKLCAPRSPEHMRLPEFSQPLVTALQLALLAVLKDWGLEPAMVVGHSSGEIAAAVAAGCMSQETAIKVAFLRGKAAKDMQGSQSDRLGMLAVGLGPEESGSYLDSFPAVKIACRNSPKSVKLAGRVQDLEAVQSAVKADGHFARMLMVNLAYHSEYMKPIGEHYRTLLELHCPELSSQQRTDSRVLFYSTVKGQLWNQGTGAEYWVGNMLSPVLFAQCVADMMEDGSVDHLIELGPSGALAGPINQIKQDTKGGLSSVLYSAALSRGHQATRPLYDLADKMFFTNLSVDFSKVNNLDAEPTMPRVIIDLPNYQWNHSVKYWHESLASKDWRYRLFLVHDLIGTKVLGTPWNAPTWRRTLRLKDVP
jgi:acyl transferase domain-containing protein